MPASLQLELLRTYRAEEGTGNVRLWESAVPGAGMPRVRVQSCMLANCWYYVNAARCVFPLVKRIIDIS